MVWNWRKRGKTVNFKPQCSSIEDAPDRVCGPVPMAAYTEERRQLHSLAARLFNFEACFRSRGRVRPRACAFGRRALGSLILELSPSRRYAQPGIASLRGESGASLTFTSGQGKFKYDPKHHKDST